MKNGIECQKEKITYDLIELRTEGSVIEMVDDAFDW